jgi:hypothetical protein
MTPASFAPAEYLKVSVIRTQERGHAYFGLRFSQKCRDRFQYIRVTLVGIIEPRCVNEYDSSTIRE